MNILCFNFCVAEQCRKFTMENYFKKSHEIPEMPNSSTKLYLNSKAYGESTKHIKTEKKNPEHIRKIQIEIEISKTCSV